MKGIATAAIAGIVGGKAQAKLEVLQSVTSEDRAEIKKLLSAGFCKAVLAEGIEGLYIEAIVRSGDQSAEVIIADSPYRRRARSEKTASRPLSSKRRPPAMHLPAEHPPPKLPPARQAPPVRPSRATTTPCSM